MRHLLLIPQRNGLLRTDTAKCKKWQSRVSKAKRNGKIAMRCKSRACNARYSIRSLNHFIRYEGKLERRHSKMSRSNIIEIVNYFLHRRHLSVREMRKIFGLFQTTIVYWLTQCREICALAVQRGPK